MPQRSVFLFDPDGKPYGVARVGNQPRVYAESWLNEVSEGTLASYTQVVKFGANPDVGTSYETVWDAGDIYTYMNTAQKVTVFSSSASDTAAGTGATQLTIYGLNGNYESISETISLAGAATATAATAFLRVYRGIVTGAGSNGLNFGTISVKNASATTTLAQILPGNNQTLMAVYTVASGSNLFLNEGVATTNSNKGSTVKFFVRPYGEPFQIKYLIYIFSSPAVVPFTAPLKIPPKADIEVRAVSLAAGGGVSACFHGWLESIS